jgi:hypothetical protein
MGFPAKPPGKHLNAHFDRATLQILNVSCLAVLVEQRYKSKPTTEASEDILIQFACLRPAVSAT